MLEFLSALCVALAIALVNMWLFPQPPHSLLDLPAADNRVLWSMIGAGVVIAIIQARRFFRERQREAAEEQKWNAKRSSQSPQKSIDLEPIVDEIRAHREAKKRESERRYFGEAITFLILIAAAGIAFLQWQTLEKTDQTLRAQPRAWLAPGKIIPPEGFTMSDNPPSGSDEIFFAFENTGKEPALKTSELIGVTIIDGRDFRNETVMVRTISEILDGKSCVESPLNPRGRAIFPSRHVSIGQNLGAEKRRLALTGGYYTLVAGCLVYETLGERHWSEVCEIFEPIPNPKGPWPTDWRTTICPFHTELASASKSATICFVTF